MPERRSSSAEPNSGNNEEQRIVVNANYELFVVLLCLFQIVNSILFFMLRGNLAEPIPRIFLYGIAFFR